MKYIKVQAKLGGGLNRNPNKLITLFALNCILLDEKNSLSSPSRAASCNSSVTVAENRNVAIVPIQHTL